MKYPLIGMLLVVLGSAAFSQTDSTFTRPAYPDSMAPAASTDLSANAVKRAVVCSGVSNHEPIDSLNTVPPTMGKVFFFTEIAGMEGKTITHRWMRDKAKVADVRITVDGNRYRCESSRSVAGKAGKWSVQVLDEDGKSLAERTFVVGTPTGQTPLGGR